MLELKNFSVFLKCGVLFKLKHSLQHECYLKLGGNRSIYEAVCRDFAKAEFHRTWQQCRVKILKNLTPRYRRVKLQYSQIKSLLINVLMPGEG